MIYLTVFGAVLVGFLLGIIAGNREARDMVLLQVGEVRAEIRRILVESVKDLEGARLSNALPRRVVTVIERLDLALAKLNDLPFTDKPVNAPNEKR